MGRFWVSQEEVFFNDLGGGKGNAKQGKTKHSLSPPLLLYREEERWREKPQCKYSWGWERFFFSLRDGREGGGGSLKEMLILYFFFPGPFVALPPLSPLPNCKYSSQSLPFLRPRAKMGAAPPAILFFFPARFHVASSFFLLCLSFYKISPPEKGGEEEEKKNCRSLIFVLV